MLQHAYSTRSVIEHGGIVNYDYVCLTGDHSTAHERAVAVCLAFTDNWRTMPLIDHYRTACSCIHCQTLYVVYAGMIFFFFGVVYVTRRCVRI